MKPPPLVATCLQAGWSVSNYQGRPVSLLEGPAFAGVAAIAAIAAGAPRVPVMCAAAGALLAGRVDDLWGNSGARGLRGHFHALRRGTVTTGSAKVALLTTVGVGTAIAVRREHGTSVTNAASYSAAQGTETATIAGCVALGANLGNLFDLRPGRALKVVLVASLPGIVSGSGGAAVLTGVASAAMACLPADLAERAMLGDAGANAAGALTGLGLALSAGPHRRRAVLGGMLALTAASEAVSFSRVIRGVGPLRMLDDVGRCRPA